MANTDVTKMVFFAVTDPKLITVDLDDLSKRHKETVAQRVKDTPPPEKADLHREYNQLRQKLFDLKQNAKCFETRTNESAGQIRLLEQRINDAIKLKKAAVAEGNGRGERTYEAAIQRLESELTTAQEEFFQNKNWNTQAARALKAFDGHARIEELKLLLDSPVAKSDTVPK